MTLSLREFLEQKEQVYQAEQELYRATVTEWRTAIEELFARIEGWIRESDPKKIIEIEESKVRVTESGLGVYEVPRLNLRVLGKWIGIIPKARKTVGTAKPPLREAPQRADGRVDITDELRRYVLYRFLDEKLESTWLIHDLKSEPKILTQEAFEKAIMSYLQ